MLKFEGSGKKIDVKILSAQIRDNYGKEMTLYAKCSSINKKKECTVNCIPQQTLSHSYIQRGEVIINFKYAVNNNWQDCKNFKMRIDYSRTTTGEICSNQIMNIPQIYIPSCTYLPPSSLSPSKVRRSQPTFRQSYYK